MLALACKFSIIKKIEVHTPQCDASDDGEKCDQNLHIIER